MASDAEVKPASKGTAKLIIWGGLGAVLLGILIWNYVTFAGGLWSADTSSPDCIKTKGIVTDIHAASGSRKTKETYFLSFEYKVEGETYDEKEQVTYTIYNRTRLGDEVEICYMKDHPGRAAVIGNDIRGENAFWVIIADLAVIVVIVMLIRAWFKRRKRIDN